MNLLKTLYTRIGFFIQQFNIDSNVNGKEIDFKYEDGRIIFDIFKIESHAIIAMEY